MSERRIVTILFCDVSDSTAMAGDLDPEDWADIMEEAFARLIEPVERYGGTVARLMGDAVLAFFGAPRAHEDDPQRAILAGLDIVDGIQPLRQRIQRHYGFDFNVRIGINTGLVVVGAFGSQGRFEYTAMGDGINLAARMQQTAEPGSVQVAHPTYRLTSPFFEFEELGEIDVKGKSDRQPAYRVLSRKLAPGRIWDIASLSTPLVGRAEAMDTLRSALDELILGRGQIISVIGEAGLGKSRLIEELHREWTSRLLENQASTDNLEVQWLQNRLVSYESVQPYGALQQRFRKAFQIERDDSPEVARAKLAMAMSRFPEHLRSRAVPIVELILDIEDDSERKSSSSYLSQLGSQEFKSESYAVILEILRGWSRQKPLVYVVDDLHWIDAASAEVLTFVLNLAEQIPILFICAYRPIMNSPAAKIREVAQARFPDRYQEVVLQPLSDSDAGHLLDALIGNAEQVRELTGVILDKAEGNPLFLEEIVRSLVDQGALRWDDPGSTSRLQIQPNVTLATLMIPDSLQALLLERIDRLDPNSRWVLQQAAVIGRTFPYDVLKSVAEIDTNLDERLTVLQRAELIRELVDQPEREFAFRHALIWETTYSTILHRHKREFHRRVGDAMIRIYDGGLDEYARRLGHHFFEAGDERAIEWLIRSARRARSVYEPRTVITDVSQVIALTMQFAKPVPADVFQLRGHAYELVGEYDLARQDFESAVDCAGADGDQAAQWQALVDLGMAWAERSYEQAGKHFLQALELARTIGDETMIAHSLNRIGNWSINVERPLDALRAHSEALAIFERCGDQAGRAETQDFLGMANYIAGDLVMSADAYRKAVALFRELGNERGLSSSLAMLMLVNGNYANETAYPGVGPAGEWERSGKASLETARRIGWRAGEAFVQILSASIYGIRGDYERALHYLDAGQELAEKIEHLQWITASYITRGTLMFDLLEFTEACSLLERGMQYARDLGSNFWLRSAGAELAGCYALTGKLDKAEALLDEISGPDSSVESLAQRQCCLRRAELLLLSGKPENAMDIIVNLEQAAPHWDPDVAIPHLSLLHARALVALGRFDEAESELFAARQQAEALEYRSLLWRVDAELASLYRLQGSTAQAETAGMSSRAVVDALAGKVPYPDIRERFRQRAYQQSSGGVEGERSDAEPAPMVGDS